MRYILVLFICFNTFLFANILDEKVKIYDIEFKKIKEKNIFYDAFKFKLKNISKDTILKLELTIYFKDKNGINIFEDSIFPITEQSHHLKPNYIFEMQENEYFLIKGIPSEWDRKNYEIKITDILIKNNINFNIYTTNNYLEKLYGGYYKNLSPKEKKSFIYNYELMRRITQQVLTRVARVNIPRDLRVSRTNVIEFKLHPNGDMTDFRFLKKSGYYVLDDTTKETIEYAYSLYPRPVKTVLVKFNIFFDLENSYNIFIK